MVQYTMPSYQQVQLVVSQSISQLTLGIAGSNNKSIITNLQVTATWLALLDKPLSAERKVTGLSPGPTNTQGLKITEENALPLLWHLQMVRHSSLLGQRRKTVGRLNQLFHCSYSCGT